MVPSPRPRRSSSELPEDAAGVRSRESPIDCPACPVGGSVPEARAALETLEAGPASRGVADSRVLLRANGRTDRSAAIVSKGENLARWSSPSNAKLLFARWTPRALRVGVGRNEQSRRIHALALPDEHVPRQLSIVLPEGHGADSVLVGPFRESQQGLIVSCVFADPRARGVWRPRAPGLRHGAAPVPGEPDAGAARGQAG